MYMTLSMVDPVTLAVGNTLKRVFILLAGVIVFGYVACIHIYDYSVRLRAPMAALPCNQG